MCLIPTFTETEKFNQVSRVKNMMSLGKFRKESDLKNFLYNLSFMNDMVVKGYCKERTEADSHIYLTKNIALTWLVANYPERCTQCGDVLYVYSSSRQYSYHVRNIILNAKYSFCKWDGIKGGYALSDKAYKKATTITVVDEYKPKPYQYDFLQKVLTLKKDKEQAERKRQKNVNIDYFFNVLAEKLPKVSKNKCVVERNIDKCITLYGEKIGLPNFRYNNYEGTNWWRISDVRWDTESQEYVANLCYSRDQIHSNIFNSLGK